MLALLVLPAFAAFNYGVAVGGAGSVNPCGYRGARSYFRGSPSANAFVGVRWERSEWFIGLSTAWNLWYDCGVSFSHLQVIQTGYLVDVGSLRLGGYLGIGNSLYLGGGFHLEKPTELGPVELAPALRVSYNWPVTIETHLLLRVTPARKRRSDAPTEDAP